MKRFCVIALVLTLVCAILPTNCLALGTGFTDVPADAWYSEDVQNAVEKGLINGKTATTYAPEDHLTYAEAVKLAACMYQLSTEGTVDFEASSPWYMSYVEYAEEKQIITTEYEWGQETTRAEYLDIFSRALPAEELAEINRVPDNAIPDVSMAHPYAASIYKMYRAGIVQGSDARCSCNPQDRITRAEVAAILTRMMEPSARKSFTVTDNIARNDAPIDYSKCEVRNSAVMKHFEGVDDTWGDFSIYDITSEQEVYFEVSWYRANGFGGVAKLNDGIATFDIQYDEAKLKGYFTISDDTVVLHLEESTLYAVAPGVEKYKYDAEVYRTYTLAGYGELDHSLFTSFLENKKEAYDITWEYLGMANDIFLVPGADYPGSFDFYKVISSNGSETYYVCSPYDYLPEYGIYQVGSNGTLQFIWRP